MCEEMRGCMNRRETVKVLAAGVGFWLTPLQVQRAAECAAVLDDIAWPKRAQSALAPGVAFFNGFRDLTASGFWSSKMGVQDLRYMGNVVVPEWKGCPPEQLQRLGVKY